MLAAQAKAVHPLGRHDCRYRPGDLAHDALQCQELGVVQVVDPVFDVPFGCDQAVTEEGGMAVQGPPCILRGLFGISRYARQFGDLHM